VVAVASRRESAMRSRIWIGILLLASLGAGARLPDLDAPLLEGAAGKQTHTAMVARNLYLGRSTWLRPMVDDVGRPGYFVKELPLVPAAIAALYAVAGRIDERLARSVGVIAWLAATPAIVGALLPSLGTRAALVAGLWFVLSPMGIVYSRAVMTDAAAVAVSLAVFIALIAWRRRPALPRALATSLLLTIAFLLKPHALFWLAPAAAVLALMRGDDGSRPSGTTIATLAATSVAGLAAGTLWYLHAAAIHREYPIPGAMVAEGWIDPALLLRADTYRELARQIVFVVFTPVGAAMALFGCLRGKRFSLVERALLAWGAGTVLQSLVLATRLFDDLARGTEYYQLALVPVASLLVARGVEEAWRWAEARSPRLAFVSTAALLLLLVAGALVETRAATRIPRRYASLIADCAAVRERTRPDEEILVLADRGGTVLYYCDRRGRTFRLPDRSATVHVAGSSEIARRDEIAAVLATASYVYLPFPRDVMRDAPDLVEKLDAHWKRVPLGGSGSLLFARDSEANGFRR